MGWFNTEMLEALFTQQCGSIPVVHFDIFMSTCANAKCLLQ